MTITSLSFINEKLYYFIDIFGFCPLNLCFNIEEISDKLGTLDNDIFSSVNKDAAKIGSAEFLDPLIFIFPLRESPPVISILSIVII